MKVLDRDPLPEMVAEDDLAMHHNFLLRQVADRSIRVDKTTRVTSLDRPGKKRERHIGEPQLPLADVAGIPAVIAVSQRVAGGNIGRLIENHEMAPVFEYQTRVRGIG